MYLYTVRLYLRNIVEDMVMSEHSGHDVGYSDKYDANYCITCNEWLESYCDVVDCEYCVGRPEKPIGACDE